MGRCPRRGQQAMFNQVRPPCLRWTGNRRRCGAQATGRVGRRGRGAGRARGKGSGRVESLARARWRALGRASQPDCAGGVVLRVMEVGRETDELRLAALRARARQHGHWHRMPAWVSAPRVKSEETASSRGQTKRALSASPMSPDGAARASRATTRPRGGSTLSAGGRACCRSDSGMPGGRPRPPKASLAR